MSRGLSEKRIRAIVVEELRRSQREADLLRDCVELQGKERRQRYDLAASTRRIRELEAEVASLKQEPSADV